MFVTTLIANYNYGKYINDAIDSCVKQTYKKQSICIVDNGSTDGSIEKIKSRLSNIKRVDSNVDILQGKIDKIDTIFIDIGKPIGPSAARNLGIEILKNHTDAFMILDADDIMMPEKIEKMVSVISRYNGQVGVVYADYNTLNVDTGNVIREYKEPFSQGRLHQECIVHSNALILKNALLQVKDQFGYYDQHMRTAEDYDLWLRISEKFMIYHIPEPLTLVRTHSENSTNTVDNSVWQQNWLRIQEKFRARHAK